MIRRQTRPILRLAATLFAIAMLWSIPVRGDEKPQEATAGLSADLEQRLVAQPAVADLVAYAYRSSPLIRAARAEWRAAVERYRVETSLDDPEVMLEGMYMTESETTDLARPDDWKVTLTQPLPLPGKLAQAGVVATTEAGIARLKLDSTVRDLTLRIRESAHELLYLRQARRLAAANREILERLRKVGETAGAASRAALVDVMKAEAQVGQVGYELLLLAESERTELTRLNSLLNREPEAAIGTLVEEPIRPVALALTEIYPLAEANREEIRIARANVDKARAMESLTRYENLPQFELGLTYGELSEAQQVGIQAGVALPLWAGKREGRLGAARAEVEKMQAMQTAERNDTRALIREVYFRLQNSERIIRLYRDDLIPQAERAMQTAETWFSEGQGSFSDYSETAAAKYNFQLALSRAQADYGKFLARLESLAGRTLTDQGSARATESTGGGR